MDRDEIASTLGEVIASVRAIDDPLERAKTGHWLVNYLKDTTSPAARNVRDKGMGEVLTAGMLNQAQLGRELGLTKARVGQIVPNPPAEQEFLGTGKVTVALAEKLEDGRQKPNPGPVIATEDVQAYDCLRKIADDVGLEIGYERIPPGGSIKLNRSNLVVICGPRLSPLIEQILESDPHLGFTKDSLGWHLVDRRTGEVYRSPMDAGDPGDVAYFGRLPRPDGKGNFLYIAGIHAMGSGGVVHWLSSELTALHSEVRTRRFSMLIASSFDRETLEVTSSQRITPIYRPEES